MPAEYANLLPVDPAPSSLTKVALGTRDEGYDLMQHYLAWRTDALQDVTLHMAYDMSPNLEHVLAGARQLTVVRDGGLHEFYQTVITADGPDARTHSVGLADSDDDLVRIAGVLLRARDALAHVHTLRISLHMLDPFIELFAALPALKHVVLYMESDNEVPEEGAEPAARAPHVFAGDLVTGLVRLQADRPALESLVVKVICWDAECPPTAQDARDLVGQLQLLQERTLPEILVKGFSADVVREVQVPEGRPRVTFDVAVDS
ncbi:hypothetical protein AURDEDRAFT_113669 [Auricularia subglabra TFB-10046 SS5]|nr:hypothetical protein AURDEDRAFT_113669 [Auricularia subglabra TFB-10046 SS5]